MSVFFASFSRASSIAVFFAVDSDLKTLAETVVRDGDPIKVSDRTIHRFSVGGHKVYAVLMGSGCVETGVTAAVLLARYRCDTALSVGPAGSLRAGAQQGTWWRVNECVAAGKVAGKGSIADPVTMSAPSTGLPALLLGCRDVRLVAGETFINGVSQRDSLAIESGATLVDMNTYGLGVACVRFGVPLQVWRLVSDYADDKAGDDFRIFLNKYDGAGGRALGELIGSWPKDPKEASSYPGIERAVHGQ